MDGTSHIFTLWAGCSEELHFNQFSKFKQELFAKRLFEV